MRKFRLFKIVLRRSGATNALILFCLAYIACALVVVTFEPNVTTFGDALWFMWVVATTVGLGDVTAVTPIGRIAAVLCSLVGIITTAFVTGVIVDFLYEVRQKQLDQSMTEFLDKLERLPELDKTELEEISMRVRAMRK